MLAEISAQVDCDCLCMQSFRFETDPLFLLVNQRSINATLLQVHF